MRSHFHLTVKFQSIIFLLVVICLTGLNVHGVLDLGEEEEDSSNGVGTREGSSPSSIKEIRRSSWGASSLGESPSGWGAAWLGRSLSGWGASPSGRPSCGSKELSWVPAFSKWMGSCVSGAWTSISLFKIAKAFWRRLCLEIGLITSSVGEDPIKVRVRFLGLEKFNKKSLIFLLHWQHSKL